MKMTCEGPMLGQLLCWKSEPTRPKPPAMKGWLLLASIRQHLAMGPCGIVAPLPINGPGAIMEYRIAPMY
jgi:hypothetical protein